MMNYVNVYDMNLQKTAVLQNAYNITEEQELNKIYSLSFNIPSTDEKTAFCKPFHISVMGLDSFTAESKSRSRMQKFLWIRLSVSTLLRHSVIM